MFHGYSQTPQYWAAEARSRYEEGYDVMATSLPGHGFIDENGEADTSRVPSAQQADRYTKYAKAMFDKARSRSDKVHVIGFSVGGAHALEVALSQADTLGKDGKNVLRSAVAINPNIATTPRKVGPFDLDVDRAVKLADLVTFGAVGKALARVPYTFPLRELEQRAGRPVGFTKVSVNNLLGIMRFGDSVQDRADARQAPMKQPVYVVVSERDPTANPKKGLQLARSIGARTVVLPISVHNPLLGRGAVAATESRRVHDTISEALRRGDQL